VSTELKSQQYKRSLQPQPKNQEFTINLSASIEFFDPKFPLSLHEKSKYYSIAPMNNKWFYVGLMKK
jgi:hypothetical protein